MSNARLMTWYHRGALNAALTLRETVDRVFPVGEPVTIPADVVVSIVRDVLDEAIKVHEPFAAIGEEQS